MIEIQNLSKNYGEIKAVKDISFSVFEGEIVGFLGPNGAGKSTTLKILTGYLTATAGTVVINGINIKEDPLSAKKLIGYLPEQNPLYPEMTVYEYLAFMAEVREIPKEDFDKRLPEIAAKCGLEKRLWQTIQTLSKGFKQRVGLAQAILHNPPILILDEPTNGLDPNQIMEIRSLIEELGKEKTVILSSHILQEVQAVCDRIIIIHQGNIVANKKKNELLNSINEKEKITIDFSEGSFQLEDFKKKFPTVDVVEFASSKLNHHMELINTSTQDIKLKISRYLFEHQCLITGFSKHVSTLEDVFRQLTTEEL